MHVGKSTDTRWVPWCPKTGSCHSLTAICRTLSRSRQCAVLHLGMFDKPASSPLWLSVLRVSGMLCCPGVQMEGWRTARMQMWGNCFIGYLAGCPLGKCMPVLVAYRQTHCPVRPCRGAPADCIACTYGSPLFARHRSCTCKLPRFTKEPYPLMQ